MDSGILSQSAFSLAPLAVVRLDLRKTRDLVSDWNITPENEQAYDNAFVCALTNSANILDLNSAAQSIIALDGKSKPDHLSHIIPEKLQKTFARGLVSLLHGKSFSMEGTVKSADGANFSAHITGWGDIQTHDRDQVIIVITKLERPRGSDNLDILTELAHAARISMLGEMTASISHEVNQPLGSIVTSAEAGLRWLSRDKPDLDEVRSLLERIVASGRRAGNIISALKGLARNTKPEREAVDITALIDEAVLILRSELNRRQIGLRLEITPDLPRVWIDRTQLLQVVVNLVQNAAQAMSDGLAWNRTLAIRARGTQQGVILEVEDSGPGVDPKVRERLFESFYTTKPTGIGMGLAICRSIVEAHGSTIELQSSAFLGARFSFTLGVEPDSDDADWSEPFTPVSGG
ncbi:sensor histidine kinase [Agrobacterium tumefaciens]|uniref:sensor histidine kinase n=1 Tax=Agrobacterium tumefaciens TaxID=358 RepID=UPI00277F4E04|nr:ATP-binding protein [Agrobacterium tumefaciens]MDP9857473.1 signal transduction histidine kinase [Agrobacterium tumefaciens]